MILDRIADQDQGTETNDRRHEHKKDLEADPQAHAEAADILLSDLVSQVCQAQRVLVFEVLLLQLQQL
jgi:hypothetical protein